MGSATIIINATGALDTPLFFHLKKTFFPRFCHPCRLERNHLNRISHNMKRLIIAITGASGVIYGIRALQILRELPGVESHVILSSSAARTMVEETDYSLDAVKSLADVLYNPKDIGAAISSGSFKTEGMLIAPCSVKTLSGIANCYDDELVVRAADVCLKERRKVVLLFRETPLHAGHIRLMQEVTANGAIVMPPVPGFYSRPQSIEDMVTQTVGRALDLLGIESGKVKRWKDTPPPLNT
jgi:4-hydroxy-3-polyprenylbenzoate decarboxylase